jgi:alkylation response protein AidB-like acyl-CoA dehydrogenase
MARRANADTQEAAPTGASAIAPDTAGWNFYDADPSFQDLLRLYLEPDLMAHIEPHLRRLGEMAANELDRAGRMADSHPPTLHHRDRFGRDEQWIEYHPAYRELEAAAYGTFGIHAMSHREGILGWPSTYPAAAKHAFTYLFNQAEFGLGCPINVTDSGSHAIRLYGSEEIKAKYLERMTTTDMEQLWQCGQYMTEKEGGSDVGSLTSVAKPEGDHWRITGEKWFCSNADAEVVLLLARPEGAGPGTRGLGLFLMPRHLDDGSLNRYRFVRLKDKLGSRSMASAEVVMDGALAYHLGELDRGFVQMAEVINWSRLNNGIKSTALMRRASHDALAVLKGRIVFGAPLIEKPLARRQMLKILVPVEQALSMWCFTADALDRAEGMAGRAPSQEAAAVLRLATPLLKFRATRDGRQVTGDALDMRGGIGYIEEWVNPRLLRDAYLGSIWEGTSNIVALDALTRAVGRHRCHEAFGAELYAKLQDAEGVPAPFRERVRGALEKAIAFAASVAANAQDEAAARQAASALYHAATAALMTWEGAATDARRGDARRLLYARLVLDHRLTARDPFDAGDTGWEDEVSGLLLGDDPARMDRVAPLL